ncbi:MAG: tRNA (N(6)-L-threonylcarbamoyladenosine(37)-C(2))-methylthiotransferase MtaB [Bacilli bacterium]
MKINYSSLGCKVNLYECEALINVFLKNNFVLSESQFNNDVYIVNTCCVTNNSEMKSRKLIRQIIKNNPNAIIVVMGCYSQIKPDEIAKIDNVDLIFGTNNRSKIFEEVQKILVNKQVLKQNISNIKDFNKYELLKIDKFIDRTRAFVKIEDGCENFCSYCIIPYTRGKIKSRCPKEVIEEVRRLTQNGIKEIVLIGINTGCYGDDLGNISLELLIKRIITEIPGEYRLRISSIEITKITDGLINLMKTYPKKICNHLHIPLQSGNERILELMNRKYDFAFFENKIFEIRKNLPNINITTDIIVGFPTETNEEFLDTYNKTIRLKFGEMHVFIFSKRKGTKAALLEYNLNSIEIKQRSKKIIELSKKMALDYRKECKDTVYNVLIEKIIDNKCIGHTENYLLTEFKNNNFKINQIVQIKIKEASYPISKGESYEIH